MQGFALLFFGFGPRAALGPIGDAAARGGGGAYGGGGGGELGTIVVVLVAVALAGFFLTRIFAILADVVRRDWLKLRDDVGDLFQVLGCLGLLVAAVIVYSRLI